MYAIRVFQPSRTARKEIRNSLFLSIIQNARNRIFPTRINGYASPRKAGGQNDAGLTYRDINDSTRKRANTRLMITKIRFRNFFKAESLSSEY